MVRIIEYTFDDPGRPGSGEKHRLLTTLLDAARHPAPQLIVLDHERWSQILLSEVAEQRLEPRRDRVHLRVIKRKMSHWTKKREKHGHFPQPKKKFRQSLVMLN